MSERRLIGHGSFYVILSSVVYKIMYIRLHTSFKGYILIHFSKNDDDTISYDKMLVYILIKSYTQYINHTFRIHLIAESVLLFVLFYIGLVNVFIIIKSRFFLFFTCI